MLPRYTLSTLLKTIVWFALFFAIRTHTTFLEAAGIWACVFVIYLSVHLKLQGGLWWLKPLLVLVAIPCLWFLAVDRSTFIERCPDCGLDRDIEQIRIVGIPVSERTREWPSLKQRIAAHLGSPCQHEKSTRERLTREWGLLWCCCPCFRGTIGLYESPWSAAYNQAFWEEFDRFLEEHPNYAAEFQTRVLQDHDTQFWLDSVGPIRDAAEDQTGLTH